jgi:hypothetical protein
MQTPKMMKHPRTGQPVFGAEIDLRDLSPWPEATIEQLRDVVLRNNIAGMDAWAYAMPVEERAWQFSSPQSEVAVTNDLASDAAAHGRLVDFGHLPNAVLMDCGKRGGRMWETGALGHPFSEPWLLHHKWEHGTGFYLVNPGDDRFEVVELQPAKIEGRARILGIADRCTFIRTEDGNRCGVAPAPVRFVLDEDMRRQINNGKTPEEATVGNCGDPVLTALLILNTRNVARETVEAPPKLQRARVKSGKLPIPSYDRVDTLAYVTAVLARGERRPRGEDRGGTHASPVPHVRMGHPRELASGRSVFVRDALVNVTDEMRTRFARSHYKVGRPE